MKGILTYGEEEPLCGHLDNRSIDRTYTLPYWGEVTIGSAIDLLLRILAVFLELG